MGESIEGPSENVNHLWGKPLSKSLKGPTHWLLRRAWVENRTLGSDGQVERDCSLTSQQGVKKVLRIRPELLTSAKKAPKGGSCLPPIPCHSLHGSPLCFWGHQACSAPGPLHLPAPLSETLFPQLFKMQLLQANFWGDRYVHYLGSSDRCIHMPTLIKLHTFNR